MRKFTAILSLVVLPFVARAEDDAALKAQMELGKTKAMVCAACHGADGKGLPIGEQLMAPAMAGSKIVNGDPSVLALVILNGVAKEDAKYLGMMLSQKLMVPKDEDLAAVMTYIRRSFGNKASAITAAQAKEYRAKWAKKVGLVKRAELDALLKPAEKKAAE